MQLDKYTLILASKSPRRKELLGHLNIPFSIVSEDVEEVSTFSDPIAFCKDIAFQKGHAVMQGLLKHPGLYTKFLPLVVSSDTIVTLDHEIYGKPRTVSEASEMLMKLSGKTHKVITSVYMESLDQNRELKSRIFACETLVTFSQISMDILNDYLRTGDSLDKAGAYGIQGKGLTFVSKVEGSYSNVVGFPLDSFIEELKTFLGFSGDESGIWRESFCDFVDESLLTS